MRVAIALSLLLLSTQLASADRHRARRFHRDTPIAQPATLTAGAIAYSPSTGNVGWSYGHPDQETAKWAAEQACGQPDCAWQVSEQGAFAVLVLAAGGGIYWAWDHSLAGAQQRALELCSANATGCAVTRWVSS